MAEIKFCGLTRPEDARAALELGAAFLGVVFAASARQVDAARAAAILDVVPAAGPRRVGVFGGQPVEEISRAVDVARLDIVQLHDDPDAAAVSAVRQATGVGVWAVVRVDGGSLPAGVDELSEVADAVLLDTKGARGAALGGGGVALDWEALVTSLTALRGGKPLVLAGGLRPENVARAIATLDPDVVDVSSGVESAPGIKDRQRMEAFVRAVRGSAPSHAG